MFLYGLSKALKSSDIQLIANTWNASKPTPFPAITDEEKKKVLEEYSTVCAKSIMDPKTGDANLLARITQLETELAKFRTSDTGSKFVPGEKHILKDCPKTKSVRDVTAWMNRVISKTDGKRINKVIVEYQIEHKDMDEDTALEEVRARLVNWGMPVQKAAEFDYEQGSRVIASCSMI